MLTTSNGGFLNPFRSVQVYEKIEPPTQLFYNFDEWELPTGAVAEMVQGEPTISCPQELSGLPQGDFIRGAFFANRAQIPG